MMSETSCPICRAGPSTRHHACRDGLTWCPGDRHRSAEPGLAQPFAMSSACTACGQPLGLVSHWAARLEPRRLGVAGLAAAFAALLAGGLFWLAEEPAP